MNIREIKPTQVRIIPETKEWLRKLAKENHRSMGSEINFILEQYRKNNECKVA